MENITPVAWILTHAIAFVGLVWFLKAKAWGPVLNLLDERRESVAKQFAEVERLRAEAEATQREYKAQLQEAHAEARETVKKAQADALKQAEKLREESRAVIDKDRQEAANRIAHETEKARSDLRNFAAGLTLAVAERFLAEGLTERQKKRLMDDTLAEIDRATSRN